MIQTRQPSTTTYGTCKYIMVAHDSTEAILYSFAVLRELEFKDSFLERGSDSSTASGSSHVFRTQHDDSLIREMDERGGSDCLEICTFK